MLTRTNLSVQQEVRESFKKDFQKEDHTFGKKRAVMELFEKCLLVGSRKIQQTST